MGGSESKEEDQVSPVIDAVAARGESERPADLKPRLLSPFPSKQLFLGLENYGNTCYCNSVLQLLLNCEVLRQRLRTVYAEYYDPASPSVKAAGSAAKTAEESILSRLSELCYQLDTSKRKKGAIGPSQFVQKVKKENGMFRTSLQQDAHEFAIYVLNAIVDDEKKLLQIPPTESGPIQRLFEGHTVAETRCLDCETKTTRPEPFLALSVDVEQNQSLAYCLKNFSEPEYLLGEDKFRCDPCSCPTIAQRAIRLHQAPPLLLIHLKRFKYIEGRNVFRKLAHRIAFPDHLGLPFNRGTDGADSPLLGDVHGQHPRVLVHYRLSGFVVHHGAGPNVGHYTACCRVDDRRTWRRFDDDVVSTLADHEIEQYFGYSIPLSESSVTATAYILLYSLES